MPPIHQKSMSNKIALLMFTTSLLLVSFSVMAMPQANALTKSTWDDSHTTARFGNSKVCGDHLCVPGEHAKWVNAISQSQKLGYGKVGTNSNGEDVMGRIADTTPMPTQTH
jgi:hypothetical protein